MTTTFPFHLMPETMTTTRLRLRAPVTADAPRIAMFVGDWDVAKMLARVPHPYREADALAWIAGLNRHSGTNYALVHANGVVGVVGIQQVKDRAVELGFWLAKPFWGRGLMTEAASAVIAAARAYEKGTTITCGHFEDNVASRRVIAKLGFVADGERCQRSLSRNAEVRALTYRLPAVTRAVAPPPVLTPA